MANRRIDANVLALRWAMACSYGRLRKEAMRILAAAIEGAGGNVSAAAEALGVGRQTLGRWIAEEPQLQRARDKARELARVDVIGTADDFLGGGWVP
jgi:ActR/RegA family two-component response regulator